MTERYVVVKLVSGEQVLAKYDGETTTTVSFKDPMLIKLYPTVNPITKQPAENVTITPWSSFVETKEFCLEKTQIIFVKNMNELVAKQYLKLLNEYEKVVPVRENADGYLEVIEEEEDEYEDTYDTVEEVSRKLNEMARERYEEEVDAKIEELEEKWKVTFVKGNETIN